MTRFKDNYSKADIEQLEAERDSAVEQNRLLRDKVKKLERTLDGYKQEVDKLLAKEGRR